MSGGRMRHEPAVGNDNWLWVSADGKGETWERYSLSGAHNRGLKPNATCGAVAGTPRLCAYDPSRVNASVTPRPTSSYTSLNRLDDNTAVVTYDHRMYPGPGIRSPVDTAFFSMRIRVGVSTANGD